MLKLLLRIENFYIFQWYYVHLDDIASLNVLWLHTNLHSTHNKKYPGKTSEIERFLLVGGWSWKIPPMEPVGRGGDPCGWQRTRSRSGGEGAGARHAAGCPLVSILGRRRKRYANGFLRGELSSATKRRGEQEDARWGCAERDAVESVCRSSPAPSNRAAGSAKRPDHFYRN